MSVVGQNASIAVASLCFLTMVWEGDASADAVPIESWRFWVPMLCLYVTAMLNSLAALLDSVSLAKIWVPAVCAGNDERLAKTNSVLRQINLFCAVVAPLVFGLLLSVLPG